MPTSGDGIGIGLQSGSGLARSWWNAVQARRTAATLLQASPRPFADSTGLKWYEAVVESTIRVELDNGRRAALEGLAALKVPCRVTIITDSRYLSDAVSKGWLRSWVERDWRGADKKPVKNVDLWQAMLPLLERHEVRFEWVRGHNNHPENERCDVLARTEAEKWSAVP